MTRHALKIVTVLLLCWTVQATPLRTIDGDTFEARVGIWLNLSAIERVRVLGVDAPERAASAEALAAKLFTEAWLARGPVTLDVCKRDSFGRLLAVVRRDGDVLAEQLINAGHGVPR